MNHKTIAVIASLCTLATAQMEKRDDALYARAEFERAAPPLGSRAPDLVLADVDGRPWALSAQKGRIVILIKGGYT
jgi:hypothetical protein